MKRLASILFLILFSVQLFSSAGYYLWFKLNRTLVIATLCENRFEPEKKCNGNCQLMKAAKHEQEQNNTSGQNVKQESVDSFIVSESTNDQFNFGTILKCVNFDFESGLMNGYPAGIMHPPC